MAKKKKEEKIEKQGKTGKIENEKLCAVLSYVLIGVIWYFADEKMKKSSFAAYHAKQGLVLFIAVIINCAIWSIPLLGWVIAPIIHVGLIILIIIGIINALNDQEKELPVIGKFAKKLASKNEKSAKD